MERLLTCGCGHRVVVTSAQAGRQVLCSACHAEISVPTLRGLADLPAADSAGTVNGSLQPTSSTWKWRGPAMAVCLLAMVVSSVFAFTNLRIWWQIDTSRDVEGHLELVGNVFDAAGPDHLSQMWDDYSGISLERPTPPDYKIYKDFSRKKLWNGQLAGGLAITMLTLLLLIWKTAT